MTPARYICDVAGVPVYEWTIRAWCQDGVSREYPPCADDVPSGWITVHRIKSSGPRGALRLVLPELYDSAAEMAAAACADTRGVNGEAFGIAHPSHRLGGEILFGDGWGHYKPPKRGTEIYRPTEASA